MKLEVEGLTASYGAARILFGVSFAVGAGEVVALLGRNGAGKSTTLRSLVGLVPQRRGRIRFDGRDISRWPTPAIIRLGLGYVPEDRRIFSELTLEENLLVGEQPPRPGVPCWRREQIYRLFPELAELRGRRGDQMSGGEQQMLAIARTLMGNPSLVLLDEPSEGLAPRIVEQLAATLQTLKRQSLGVLLSEQNLALVRLLADRVYVIEKGGIRFHGSLAELAAEPAVSDAYLAV